MFTYIEKYLIGFALIAMASLPLSMLAQDTVHITGNSYIKSNGGNVFLDGSLINSSTNATRGYFNSGELFITGNVENNSPNNYLFAEDEQGTVFFIGDSAQYLKGSNTIQLDTIYLLKNGDTLYLETEMVENNRIHFNGGIIDLNGNNLLLNNSSVNTNFVGSMGIETDSSHIMGQTGYVYVDNIPVSKFNDLSTLGMGIQLNSSTSTGNISVQRSHTSETTVTDGSIRKYYNLMPSQTGSYDVVIHYLDTTDIWDINCTESDFKLWSSYTNGYYYERKYGGVDTENNIAETSGDMINIKNPTRITVADHICDVTPIVDIGDTIHICAGTTGAINAENNGSFFVWNTGETTQIIHVNTSGTYFVTVTNPRGCYTVDSVELVLDSVPHTDFSWASAVGPCPGTIINFSNSSTIDPTAAPLTYLWQFGDGNSTTEENPSHAFLSAGTFHVTLTAYSTDACAINKSQDITIFSLPEMSFTYNNACLNQAVPFDNTTPNSYIIHWNMGNGVEFSAGDPLNYYYNTYGTYPVQLIVTDNHGCTDSITHHVEIYPLPTAGFTVDDAEVCLQNSSVFHNTSTIPYGTLSYHWDFGNGYSNTTPNPIIVYGVHGTFPVTLIANSAFGCSDTAYSNVTIRPIPDAAFSVDNVCEGDSVYFVNETTIDPVETLSYSWTFGDGTSSNLTNPHKLYEDPGSYTVILLATSAQGCSETVQKTVYVYANPTVNFICQPVCFGNNSVFQNVSLPANGSLSFSWDFGDGDISDLNNPQHNYNSEGTYEVELIAESGQGCSDTIVKDIIVYPTPIVDLGDDIHYCHETLVLDALNSGATYYWSNNAASQTITVSQNGNYAVTVTNNFGCSASDNVYVTLNVPVVIGFDGENIAVCDSLQLDAGYPGAEYLWSTGATTQHIMITESGIYSVSIWYQGCPGEASVNVVVYESPQLELGDIITECVGVTVILDAENPGSDYLWSTNETNQQIGVSLEGVYSVTVTDQHSCTVSDDVEVVFNSLPVDPFPADTVICGSGVLNAQNSGAQFEWNNGSHLQSIPIAESGEYWVNIIGGNSCSISDTVNVTVNPKPIVNIGNDTALCQNAILILDAGNPNNIYSWNNNQTSQSIDVVASGDYAVQVTNEYGCASIDSISVLFNPNPTVNLGANLYLCSNQMGLLNAGNAGVHYSWGSDFGFYSNENPVMVADSGKYWVDVLNEFGCTSSDTVRVQYSQESLTAYFLAASNAMRGDTVRFVNVSYPSPTHYLWNFKDGSTSTEAGVKHVFYIEGTYWVELMVSNNYCSDTISKSIHIIGTSKNYIPPDVEIAVTEDLFEILSEKLYPNPNEGIFTYELQLNQQTLISLTLFDINGKMIYQEQIDNASYINKVFSFNHLMPGMYVLRMNVHNTARAYKIVIM